MLNFENIYEDNSGNLVVAEFYDVGKTYITEDGTRVRYMGVDGDSLKFVLVNKSPLVANAKVSEFENPKTALPKFWHLLDKNLKYDDDADTSENNED